MSIKKENIFKKKLMPLIYSAINLTSVRRFEIYLLVDYPQNLRATIGALGIFCQASYFDLQSLQLGRTISYSSLLDTCITLSGSNLKAEQICMTHVQMEE